MAYFQKRRLRNYLVDRDVAIRVIVYNLIYMSTIAIVAVFISLYPTVVEMVFSENLTAQYNAAQSFLAVVKKLAPALLLIIILCSLHIIIVMHRICGPLVNFSHSFKRLGEGDMTRKVRLRKGDYLEKESQQINSMIDGLSTIFKRIMTDHNKLIESLEEISSHVKDNITKEKIDSAIKTLNDNAQILTNTLSSVKLMEEAQQ